jgi:hypothetical protein
MILGEHARADFWPLRIPQTLALTMMGMASDSIFRRYAIADSAIQLAAQKKVALFRKQA